MKKQLIALGVAALLIGGVGIANATLTTIGTANYGGSDYNLIWDDDNNGNSVVWLDYTHDETNWSNQNSWAAGLDGDLTYNIDAAYTVTWDDAAWRLPSTVDGLYSWSNEGDPDNDGVYTYTAGYNLANSEMGHLFYEELGNLGYFDTSNNVQTDYGLKNTGDFNYLGEYGYWSGTEYADNSDVAWFFDMRSGVQNYYYRDYRLYGLALRSGQVSTAPVPEPATMLLLGTGLIGLAGFRKKLRKS